MPDRDPPIPSVPELEGCAQEANAALPGLGYPDPGGGARVWVAVARIRSEGPKITIVFQSAEGLEAGKTKINYRGVDIGTITAIRLARGSRTRDSHGADDAQDRGFSGRGHAAMGGTAAHLGRQRDRAGDAHLRGLYRHRNRQLEGAQARLRGARDSASNNRQCARAFLRAEDLRPGFAGHRHADILPAAAGRPGGVIHRWTRTESFSPSRYSCGRPTISTSLRTHASGRRAESTCRSPRAG